MKRVSRNTNINGDYLREVVAKNELTQAEFGRSLGRSDSYICNSLHRGYMHDNVCKLLCQLYDADYAKLTTIPQPEPEQKQEPAKKVMMADDASIAALARCMVTIDAKLDKLDAKLDEILAMFR